MITSTAEYALRIMIVLAEAVESEGSLTSQQVAERTKVPTDYTVKVLQWLGRAGLVSGRRGRGGGFRIECDPERTSLLAIVNAIEPIKRIRACPLYRESHKDMLCPLHSSIDQVMESMETSLGELTIQAVIDGAPGGVLCREETLVKVSVNGIRSW